MNTLDQTIVDFQQKIYKVSDEFYETFPSLRDARSFRETEMNAKQLRFLHEMGHMSRQNWSWLFQAMPCLLDQLKDLVWFHHDRYSIERLLFNGNSTRLRELLRLYREKVPDLFQELKENYRVIQLNGLQTYTLRVWFNHHQSHYEQELETLKSQSHPWIKDGKSYLDVRVVNLISVLREELFN